MTKKKKKEINITTIVNEKLSVPDSIKPYCSDVHIFVNAVIVEKSREIFSSLARTRGIPVNIDAEVSAINDPIAFEIYQRRPDLKVMDDEDKGLGSVQAIKEARHYYMEERDTATTDAMLLAVSMYTKIDSSYEPKPYEDASVESFRKFSEGSPEMSLMGEPDWLETPLPLLPRRLTHNYERRLKQLWDIMQEGGLEFANDFFLTVNQAIAQLRSKLEDADKDDDGFPPVGDN